MDTSTALHRSTRTERILFAASFLAYLACLQAPAYATHVDAHPGWGALALGLVGLPLGYLAWLANPLLWYAWLAKARARHPRAVVSVVFAILFALSFLLHEKIPVGSSGDYAFRVQYGYGLWLLSMGLTLFSAYLGFARALRT